MEESAPSRDHDPVPAVRQGSCPRGQVQGLLWLFSSSLKATFSLQRALPSHPKEQTCHTTASSGTMVRGKLKLTKKRRFFRDLQQRFMAQCD